MLQAANLLLCHIWKLVPPDVTHVIKFYQAFSRAVEKIGAPGDEATVMQKNEALYAGAAIEGSGRPYGYGWTMV